uniref:Centromere-associated protein E n=1 Tax=Lepisosteus oculatus TaxID=7918 RepID=W5MIM0_LEPOC
MAGESAVKVCVRVRPLIQREEAEVSNVESVPIYWKTDQQTVYQVDGPKTFSFDRVFNVNESTSQVYDEVAKPLVISAIKGYNGTIFAYGQTSSGKTFTMMGSNESLGVIPLAIHDIFETIAQSQNMEFLLRVSYMEIYNETVTDLLVDSTKRKPLEIREGINRTVYVADLTEEVVVSASQVLEWIKKGEKNRHYGDTKMNQRSSRSHTIFRMILESRERSDPSSGEIADQAVMVSHLNLVDLAGSERASQTGAEGLRLKEGCNINRSLFTLGQVIKKLTDGNGGGFTNYRDSKLTRILQNSLGGNAKTVIICTITPATVEETLSTLQFASTAKHMKNDPHVNEVLDDGALMRRYRNEIVDLKRRLEEKRVHIQLSEVKERIAGLEEELQKKIRETWEAVEKQNAAEKRVSELEEALKAQDPRGEGSHVEGCREALCKMASSYRRHRLRQPVPFFTEGNYEKDFRDTIQLCETLVAEKEELSAKLNLLKEELDALWKEKEGLQQEKVRLQQEIIEKEEQHEFNILEQEVHKQSEAELEAKSNELQNKEEWIAELENMRLDLEKSVAELKKELEKSQEGERALQTEVCDVSNELCVTRVERDDLLSAKVERDEEIQRLTEAVQQVTEDLRETQTKLSEADQKMANLSEQHSAVQAQYVEVAEDCEKLKTELESSSIEKQQCLNGMEDLKLQVSLQNVFATEELRTHVASLTQEREQLQEILESVRAEKSQLKADLEEKEREQLQETLESVRAEKSRLQAELEENVEMAVESQAELQKQQQLMADFRSQSAEQLTQLEQQLKELNERLKLVTSERDAFLSERTDSAQMSAVELEELRRHIASLAEERDQLQEILESVRAEKQQLKADLEENVEMSVETQEELRQQQQLMTDLKIQTAEKEARLQQQEREQLQEILESVRAEKSQLKAELEEKVRVMVETQEELRQQQQLISDLKTQRELRHLRDSTRRTEAELEELRTHITSLTQEREQLQETLESVRAEKSQLQAELEEKGAELEELRTHITSLTQEREQLQETLESVRAEKSQLQADLERTESDLQELRTHIDSLTQEREQLQETLESVRAEKSQLNSLEDAVSKRIQRASGSSSEHVSQQAQRVSDLLEERQRRVQALQQILLGSLVEENLLLLERLEGSEKEIKTMQLKIKKLEGSLADAEAKAADRKRAADGMQMELQKLVAQVKERDESISTLRRSLSELEKRAEKGASPYIEELETLRSKLVKMEMERTGLLKKQEQTVAAMTAALEHRDESLRKLKETLRKSQQDQEASFVADEKPHTKAPVTCGGGSGIVQSTMMLMIKAEKAKLEAEVHQQKKKIGQMESVVSSLQAEASKWKGRARKLKETSGLKGSLSEMETLCDNQPNVSPRTPTKRRQVTSEGFILDSPKSKFFDSRSGSLSVACPKQFFDNSTLGTIPDVNPTAEPNSEGDWWSLAPQKDGAENCKTQ